MPFSNWKGTSCLPPQDLCSSYTSHRNLSCGSGTQGKLQELVQTDSKPSTPLTSPVGSPSTDGRPVAIWQLWLHGCCHLVLVPPSWHSTGSEGAGGVRELGSPPWHSRAAEQAASSALPPPPPFFLSLTSARQQLEGFRSP